MLKPVINIFNIKIIYINIVQATLLDLLFLALSTGIYLLIRFTIYEQNYQWVKIGINLIFGIHFFSFLYTIIVNPGIPERKYYTRNYIRNINKEDKSKYNRCKICNIITPKTLNVTHCYYCNVCVINHDHHCTCFGKCVGRNNCCTFYTSLVSIPLYMVMGFITLVAYAIYIDEVHTQMRRQARHKH